MREGDEKIDVASAQHNLTTKLPPEMESPPPYFNESAESESDVFREEESGWTPKSLQEKDDKSNVVAHYRIKTSKIAQKTDKTYVFRRMETKLCFGFLPGA